ncbi:NUDIX domain-containing protein [Yoonia maricola]|uniref:NUDIX domain-containing protein n=1 Tax=Yoonia maricola TaxID=420999 RepID=A0A2M8WPY7_9RHOB|nr:NUDIX domain-containing protein [Yoonia maricola]PJI93005.1 NUDIX domain-containing protein [Yoonia maricola]
MTVWRPRPTIRVIAIGLHWRDGRLLAAEVNDDQGVVKGVRPLGGGVEFGETWRDALIREFDEELNVTVTVAGRPLVLENLYEHYGEQGHEIVFAADVLFPDGAFAATEMIHFKEDNGTPCVARWFDLDDLAARSIPLFPLGLVEELRPPASPSAR